MTQTVYGSTTSVKDIINPKGYENKSKYNDEDILVDTIAGTIKGKGPGSRVKKMNREEIVDEVLVQVSIWVKIRYSVWSVVLIVSPYVVSLLNGR